MSDTVLVLILRCETRPCDKNIHNLKWIFSDPYFVVQVCEVEAPPKIPNSKTLTPQEYLENYYMRKALTYAAEGPYVENSEGVLTPQYLWTKLPCIIVKDSSISNVTPSGVTNYDPSVIGGMKQRIMESLQIPQVDLVYLCTWNDKCEKYTDVKGVGNIAKGSTLKWTISPNSTQAILYKPVSRDFIVESLISATVSLTNLLNFYVTQAKLLAVTFVPNIIDYDISLAVDNADYKKANKCAPVPSVIKTNSNTILWFIVIMLLILVVAWGLINVGPQYAPISN